MKDLKTLTAQLKLAAKDTSDKHLRSVFRNAAEQLETYDKELRKARKFGAAWKKRAYRSARELNQRRKASVPSGQSVRTVSGGLPGLGKNRRN